MASFAYKDSLRWSWFAWILHGLWLQLIYHLCHYQSNFIKSSGCILKCTMRLCEKKNDFTWGISLKNEPVSPSFLSKTKCFLVWIVSPFTSSQEKNLSHFHLVKYPLHRSKCQHVLKDKNILRYRNLTFMMTKMCTQ